jgi:hypothetical protein
MIFIGIAMVVLIAISCAAWFLLPNGAAIARDVESKRERNRNQQEVLDRKTDYQNQIDKYDDRLKKVTDLLFPGDKPNETSAEIQTRLKEFAVRSGVEITQKTTPQDKKIEDPLTKQKEAMLTKVSVHIEIACDPTRLAKFLVEIQNASPFLKAEELSVLSYRGVQRRPAADSRGGTPDRGGMSDLSSLLGSIIGRSGAGSDSRGSAPSATNEVRASMTVVGYIRAKPNEKPAGGAVAAVR